MFMVIAKALIRNEATLEYEPSEICERVNDQLCAENEQGLFVTCWLGCVNIATGQMKFANAAHNPPVLYDGDSYKFLEQKSGIMLAAIEGSKYVQHEIQLKKGSRLFIYTDGVTEAQNKNGALFGESLLLGALAKTAALSSKETVQLVNKEVERFAGGADQADDITVLSFELDEVGEETNASASTDSEKSLVVAADDAELQRVTDFVRSFAPQDITPDEANKIDLAVEEIFVNISHYAYENGGDVEIVCKKLAERKISVAFKDSGIEFDPLAKGDPDFTESVETRKLGGFGIYLTKKFMDSVSYERQDGKNILTLVKTFA